MRLFIPGLLLLLLLNTPARAQVKVTMLNQNTLPPGISYKGKLINAAHYSDSNGEHIVLTTETGITPGNDAEMPDARNAALDAYNYLLVNGKSSLTWKVHDFINDCPVDLAASFIPKTFAVTDLDKNGEAEVWLMYKTVCHGDVSPSNMKVIMYAGSKKHAMRGTNKVKVSATEYYGGAYVFDNAFGFGPKVYRDYAIKLWNKNLLETWK